MRIGKQLASLLGLLLVAVLLACDSSSTEPDRLPLYRAVDVHSASYRLLITSSAVYFAKSRRERL